MRDLKYALRRLAKSPLFAAAAAATLALGIGANATVFILADAVLFRNLPFPASQRVLYLTSVNRRSGERGGMSYPDYASIKPRVRSFAGLGALFEDDTDLSDAAAGPIQISGCRLTPGGFSVLGMRPLLGRGFQAGDARPGAPPVAILAYGLWQRRYGGNAGILGKTVRVNDVPTMVVGVMPPGFRFPGASRLWLPFRASGPWRRRDYRALTVFGRLAPGAAAGAAGAELDVLARDLAAAYPGSDQGLGLRAESYSEHFTNGDTVTTYLALLGAVFFVLLIACANVANLLLARASGRAREISTRIALGAGSRRIIRQLLTESLCLAALGGGLGTLLGLWGARAFRAELIPGDALSYSTFALGGRVIAYLAGVTILTSILFGLAPALRLARLDVSQALKEAGQGLGLNLRARSVSGLLIVGEIALAFVLLVGAGLMVRSFLNMTRTPIGADTHNMLSMDTILRASKYPSRESVIAFYARLRARVAALPGVEAVTMASNFPGDGWTDFDFQLEPGARVARVGGVVVSPSYFSVLGIRPIRGRGFGPLDGVSGAPTVVVNLTFATRAWGPADPVGRRLRLEMPSVNAANAPPSAPQDWLTVIGVVPDIVQSDSSEGAHDPLVYLPFRELPIREMVIGARTSAPPDNLAAAFRRAVQGADSDLPVTDLRSLDALLRERAWPWRVYGLMFVVFAALALLLACVGIYAVTAHVASARTREIGLRMALGAPPGRILGMVFARGARLLLAGVGLGLLASAGLAQALRTLLIGIAPTDPLTLATVGSVLLAAGALGCLIPAWRAMRADPMAALRQE
ncbi:MAG: ABC transporter permease [Terriglobales bacterium]